VTQNGLSVPFKDQFTDNESTEIKETAGFSSIISTGSPSHYHTLLLASSFGSPVQKKHWFPWDMIPVSTELT
jgi:hypothetical protein